MNFSNLPTPPWGLTDVNGKRVRNSNLELYRIIVMLMIVAHHYVVNSGLMQILKESDAILSSGLMLLFGAWGKTGINCFVLITGYFMCKSSFSLKKLVKLYLQIAFYGSVIYVIFCIAGKESFSPFRLLWSIWPVKSIALDFVSCFLIFYLFIPILNILVNSMDRRLHRRLVVILVVIFSVLPSFPRIGMTHNYVSWFMALYMIASYIRKYGMFPGVSHRQWGYLTIASAMTGSLSVLIMIACYRAGYVSGFNPYFFVSDSNKFLSVAIAVCSFMYFKDLKIPCSKFINLVGASTFGVLLIHANSDTMRQWLWQETVDCVGHYGDSAMWTLGYAMASVLTIFTICAGIDWFRAKYLEPRAVDFVYDRSKRLFNRLQII